MAEPTAKLPNMRHDAIFQSPIADAIKISVHVQDHGICRDFEHNAAKCVEAYGFYRGLVKCEAMLRDFSECLTGEKRRNRSDILYGELTRQVENGERQYEEPPFLSFIQ